MKKLNLFFFFCIALLAHPIGAQTGFWLPVDANGWTTITPTPGLEGTRKIYVSSSDGNDGNDGLSEATPKKTIDAAMAVTRDGYPDWILLKRGDTFAQTSAFNRRWKSGRSASEPMVMTYYGNSGPRPVIKIASPFINWDGVNRNHTAYIGLDLYHSVSDPDSEDFKNIQSSAGFRFIPGSSGESMNVLVEDCLLRFCDLVAQELNAANRPRNVVVRRNIITYVWVHNTTTAPNQQRTSGIYVQGVDGFIMEENVFHHNGYSLKVEGADANMYSHNVYLQNSLGGTILVRGNLLSYGAAHGVQLRSGGTAGMNAFVGHAVGMNVGYSSPIPTHYTGETLIADNVITDGRPMIPNRFSAPQTAAIYGLTRGPVIGDLPVYTDNIIANIKDTQTHPGGIYPFGGPSENPNISDPVKGTGSGNIGWNWYQAPVPDIADPSWSDPDRNADRFAREVAGMSSWKTFIDAATNRPVGQMPFNLTAYAYVNYIREGFDKLPVAAPYEDYDNCQGVAVAGISIIPSEVTLVEIGDTKELIASFLPSDACNRGLMWSSDDEAIATVDADGVVMAVSVGITTIRVTTTEGNFSAGTDVTVTGMIAVTGVTLAPESVSIGIGQTETLAATVLPANATHREVTWSSDNPAVAVVSAGGVVVGVSNGTARITVKTVEGNFEDESEVTVTGHGAYLLDAVNIAYVGNGSQRWSGIQTQEGPDRRSVYTYKPGVSMPAASGSTWPVSYGGWNYLSPNVAAVYHDFAYSNSNPEIRSLLFQNDNKGTLRALIYWPLPSQAPLDKISLSVTLGQGYYNNANTHFVVKSGDDFYISAAFEGSHSKVFGLDAASTDWYPWDFAVNEGNNFNPDFEDAIQAGSQVIDAIGVFITGESTTSLILRNLRQVMYTVDDTGLPVKLTAFTSERENAVAQLRWSTAEETNSFRFDVEYSLNARSWAKLAEVASTGESTTLSNYHYTHASPANGLNYYRLKMVDQDGTFEFSPVRSVAIDKADNIVTLYPNPATGRFLLKNIAGSVRKVEIFNLAGNRLVSLASIPAEGVDVLDLAEGVYVVKIEKSDGTVVNSRIVVQK